MKIFHGPSNVGGMATLIAEAQRSLGHDAVAFASGMNPFGFSGDRPWPPGSRRQLLTNAKFLLSELREFDVFQFYFGISLTGLSLTDVPILKRFGKQVFFYFCGCDARDSKVTVAKYEFSACKACWPMHCSPNREHAIEVAGRYADGVFVSTPDLLEFVPGSVLLPQPVDLDQVDELLASRDREVNLRERGGPVRIAHAPTDRQKKGSDHITAAVERLQADGVDIDLRLHERMTRAELLRNLLDADIIIDQVLIGAYGMFSVEAMALGVPVVCYLRDDLRPCYPEDPPIVSADPNTLYDVLGKLIADRGSWGDLGWRGQTYARGVHGSQVVADHLARLYAAEKAD